ncbi:MAG: thioredoxin family protein, partial [Pseudomonadota bacterium]
MALVSPPETPLGSPCPDFELPDPGGKPWTRDGLRGPNGLVVAFICNHCPYVIAMAGRLAADFRVLADQGIGGVCIMSNNWQRYPADAPDKMPAFAQAHGLAVPYLVDETQDVARAFGAVCTPDLFGYGPDLTLGYRGRLDDAGPGARQRGRARH